VCVCVCVREERGGMNNNGSDQCTCGASIGSGLPSRDTTHAWEGAMKSFKSVSLTVFEKLIGLYDKCRGDELYKPYNQRLIIFWYKMFTMSRLHRHMRELKS